MAQTLANYDSVLKEFYEGAVRETVNSEVPMFKILDESGRDWSGRRVVFPVHTTRSSGVGSRADGGTLPSASNQGYQQSVVSSTYHYGRISVTGPTIRSGMNAFAEAMQSEMQGITNDLKNDLGRQTWGDGTGRLAQVGADGASATAISVFNRFAEPGQPGARYVSQGQLLDGGTTAAPTGQFSAVAVISTNLSQNPATTVDTITVSDSTVTVSQSDTFLFNAGAAGIEMLGILGLVDQFTESNMWGSNAFAGSAIQGINRVAQSQWNAQVLGNSGVARVINSDLLQQAFDAVNTESAWDVDQIMGHHSVVRAVLDHVSADRRYQTAGFDAGHSSLSYNGVPIERDRQAPYNSLLLMKKMCLRMFTLLDLEFADDDGSILSRVQNQDAFEAYLRTYRNIGINETPKALLMIRDIQTDFS